MPQPLSHDALIPSPEILDGPWLIRQGGKIAGYIWSHLVTVNGVAVGTIEHWFLVVDVNGNGATHQVFATAATWDVSSLNYNMGSPNQPANPPGVAGANKPKYQAFLVQGAKSGLVEV